MALTKISTGGITDATIATADIAADAVTAAKIADDAINSEHYTDGSIDTAHIADNQITLAKMAGGTDGQIITYDASGDPVAVGPGTDGQVLTSTGAGSPPAFENIPASGISDVVSDTSPQLGGNLDIQSHDITGSGNLDLEDAGKIKLGTGDDLSIYHSGISNVFATSNGNIELIAGSEYMAKLIPNGAVELYHDNSKKFETTSYGTLITGECRASGSFQLLDYDGSTSGYMKLGADDDAKIYHTGSDLFVINSTGGFNIKCDSGTGVGEGVITFSSGTGTERARFEADGHFRPSADNSYWLGTSSYRWANVYTADLNLSNEGSSNNFDGTWGSWSIQEGESDLFLKNNRSGKKYKFNLTEVS